MKDERKSVEIGEKVCQLKFENLSMELELKEVEVKESMEEDMFDDDEESFLLQATQLLKLLRKKQGL